MSRNNNIDVLKIILSFFVIAAHVFSTNEVEGSKNFVFFIFQGLARLTVPLFFIISGYFIGTKINDIHNVKNSIIKIGKMFLIWQLIYFSIEFNFYNIGVLSLKKLLLDSFYGIAHLWYLMAFIQGLLLLYLIRKFSTKFKLLLAIGLFLSGFIFQFIYEKKITTEGSVFNTIYDVLGSSRNGIFYGLPYLILGNIYNDIKKYLYTNSFVLAFLFLLLLAESYLNMKYNSAIFNIFFIAFPISILLFDKVLNIKKITKFKSPQSLSLGIYLIHFYVLFIVFKKYPLNTITSYYISFICVSLITLVVWFVLNKLNSKIKILF